MTNNPPTTAAGCMTCRLACLTAVGVTKREAETIERFQQHGCLVHMVNNEQELLVLIGAV